MMTRSWKGAAGLAALGLALSVPTVASAKAKSSLLSLGNIAVGQATVTSSGGAPTASYALLSIGGKSVIAPASAVNDALSDACQAVGTVSVHISGDSTCTVTLLTSGSDQRACRPSAPGGTAATDGRLAEVNLPGVTAAVGLSYANADTCGSSTAQSGAELASLSLGDRYDSTGAIVGRSFAGCAGSTCTASQQLLFAGTQNVAMPALPAGVGVAQAEATP